MIVERHECFQANLADLAARCRVIFVPAEFDACSKLNVADVYLGKRPKMTLFANDSRKQHLVEFRAGKMFMRGTTVYPDKRKGLVYVHQSSDSLMHFCWKDRLTGTVEDFATFRLAKFQDLILFPEDVEFISAPQCTTGRVFLLKFKNSTRKLFFWMQEPKADKDDEYCRKVNELLNSPSASSSSRNAISRTGAQENITDQIGIMNELLGLNNLGSESGEHRMDWQSALAGMDQQQLMQLLNLMSTTGGSASFNVADLEASPSNVLDTSADSVATGPLSENAAADNTEPGTDVQASREPAKESKDTSVVAPGNSRKTIQVADLRNILTNMNIPLEQEDEAAVKLEDVLTADNLMEVVRNRHYQPRLFALLPEEPPVLRDEAELIETVHSPQFRQAVSMFSSALQTGELGPLMSQFGLPPAAVDACVRGDIQSVAEILQKQASESASTTATAPKESSGESGTSGTGDGSSKKEENKAKKEDDTPKKDNGENKDSDMELD